MIEYFHTSPFILHPYILTLAFLLDLAIGDPRWLPHPVRTIGSAISRTELFLRRYFKSPLQERTGGMVLVFTIVASVFGTTFFICETISNLSLHYSPIHPLTYSPIDLFTYPPIHLIAYILLVYLTATTIATRELVNSAKVVIRCIKEKNLEAARQSLSMIVGRETDRLSDKEVLKATMETLAENLSDGVIAPLFYLTIGGLPLAMAYKAINTLDSMVGYRDAKYINFGWASARLDDIANYIPARLTGFIIAISSLVLSRSLSTVHSSIKTMLRDGGNHLSPNSGIPEAAMAGALGIRMGGPSIYSGVVVEKQYIGENRTKDYVTASEHTVTIVIISSVLTMALAAIILFIRSSLW